eukprot:evm.model.scf_867EXC.2 EVM.evm.TU.scf_867EXC.2   scf_867EXC:6191-11980(+)
MGLLVVALSTVGSVEGAKKALSFEWVPEYPNYYIGEKDLSCVITVKAPKKVAAVRAPVSVTAVLDASGSMEGLPLAALKNTAEYMVEALGPADYLGVVTYNDFVYETVELTAVDYSLKPSIKASLRSIIAGGGTNLSGGLFAGIDQQKRGRVPYSKYVLLFTDGKPNGGVEDINEIEAYMSQELAEDGSPIVYTLGFGYDQDPNFLYRIAHTGRGSYVYVNSAADIATSFGQVLGGLLSVYAHDIHCTLTPLGGATIKRVQTGGYITPGKESWQLFFADLYAAEKRDILIDMKIPILLRPQSKQEVLRVDVTYFDPFTGEAYSAKPIIVVIERTLVPRPVYILPAPVVDVSRVRYRCAADIEEAVVLSSQGKYLEAKKLLDGTLAYIAGSSVVNDEEVQQYRQDCIVVQDVVKKEEVIPAPVAAGYVAAAKSIGDQRAAGVTNDLKGPSFYTTAPKQEEAKKAKVYAEPVIPAEAQSTAVGFADATVSDDGKVYAQANNEASVNGEDSTAYSDATSTANGDDATATSTADAFADSSATESGNADATAASDATATGEDSTATAVGNSTALAGGDGSATATTDATARALAPEGGATANAFGTSEAFSPDGEAIATTNTFAEAQAPEGAATAIADGTAFAQGQDAFAEAPSVAYAEGETADAFANGGATAFGGDEGRATAKGSGDATADGQEGAFAAAAAPAYASSGEEGVSTAIGDATATATTEEGNAEAQANGDATAASGDGGVSTAQGTGDAFAVSAEGPAVANGAANADAAAGENGYADATADGLGVASGTDATATGSGDATASVGDEEANASGSGSVRATKDGVESSAEGSASGDGAKATASATAISDSKRGPRGKATGTGSATAADGAATAEANGTAVAFAPAPAPEPAPLIEG